jgi:putative ABC transport system permease protein
MSWHGSLGERLRSLFGRERDEADMDDEFRFHIDMETEKLIRNGVPPGEARRRALVAFGGLDRYAEQTRDERGTRPLDDLIGDMRFALRQLRRSPGFSLVTTLTIGLGIGATVLGFAIADAVILRPLPYPDTDRLVRIQETNPGGDAYSIAAPNFLDLAAATRRLDGLAAFSLRSMSVLGGSEPFQVRGMAVTPGYLGLLGGNPALGRAFEADDAPPATEGSVVILSHGTWERLFGADPDILGTSINVDGTARTVVGVAPPTFRPLADEELWVPFRPDPDFSRRDHRLEAIGRLAPGVSLDDARSELDAVSVELGRRYPSTNGGWGFRVRSFPEWLIPAPTIRAVGVLSGAGALLLLLCCASVSTLLLARVSTRRHEVALRSALGAGRARIVRQLLVESLVQAAGGALLGVLLTAALLPTVRRAGAFALPRLEELALDRQAVMVALAVTVGAAVLFGLAPALHAVRGGFSRMLQASGRTVAAGGRRLRNALVATQMALAVVLLVGAGLLAATFVRLGRVDPGFEAQEVLSVRIAPRADRYPAGQRPVGLFYREVLDRIRALPGVTAAGAYNVSPFLGPRPANRVAAADQAIEQDSFVEIQWRTVTPGFFEAMGIELVRGRYLGDEDDSWDDFMSAADQGSQRPAPVVIDTRLARRLWPGGDPVGRHLVWNRPQGSDVLVVGVVEPIRDVDLAAEPAPMLYLPNGIVGMPELTLLVRTASGATDLAAGVREAIWAVDSDTPVPDIAPLQRALDRERAGARLNMRLVGALAAAALLLATLSLYGVVSFVTARRTREIGIRVALGADGWGVVGPVVAQALRVVLFGAVVGVGGALLLARFLRSILFDVEPTHPGIYVIVVLTLALSASLAAYLPARRASRVEVGRALAVE